MLKLTNRLIIIVFLSMLFLEVFLRLFNLSGITLQEVNIDGNRMLKPGSNGIWVRGGFGEIKSHYSINHQGWNSIVDYADLDDNKIKIAIIGDSYIQGMHVDVDNSIGRILEKKSSNYVVHEFGRDGANIVDYSLVYNKWIRGKYDYVFILASDDDLISIYPSFMNQGNKIPSTSILRTFYNSSYTIRYLNINRGLLAKFNSLLKSTLNSLASFNNNSAIASQKQTENQINIDSLQSIDLSVVFLYESGKLDTNSLKNHKTLQIVHELYPIRMGFEGHWNINGRINCANTIDKFMRSQTEQPTT